MSRAVAVVLGATEVKHVLDSDFSSKDPGGHTAKVAVTRWCGWKRNVGVPSCIRKPRSKFMRFITRENSTVDDKCGCWPPGRGEGGGVRRGGRFLGGGLPHFASQVCASAVSTWAWVSM